MKKLVLIFTRFFFLFKSKGGLHRRPPHLENGKRMGREGFEGLLTPAQIQQKPCKM